MPMIKIVQRGYTTAVDAYLTPHIHRYIHSFAAGFKLGLNKLNVLCKFKKFSFFLNKCFNLFIIIFNF